MRTVARFFMRWSMFIDAEAGEPFWAIEQRWKLAVLAEIDRVFEPEERET